MFFLELSHFFDDPADVGNLISGSSAFSKTSLNIWKFTVHILLKPGLENFEHYFTSVWKKVKSLRCPTLCDPMDCSLPGSSLHGILQANILEWVAISFSRGSSQPRDRTWVSHIVGRCFNLWATREACNYAVVWAFFGICFLWDWNENWSFPVPWPLLSFPNLLTYWVQHLHSIIFQVFSGATQTWHEKDIRPFYRADQEIQGS